MTANVIRSNALTDSVARRTLRDGGMTLPAVSDGYMVGGVVPELIVKEYDAKSLAEHVGAFMTVHAEKLSQPGMHMGTWVNDETGNVHLDVSERFEKKWLALTVAAQRGELAIWDVKVSKSIAVGPRDDIY